LNLRTVLTGLLIISVLCAIGVLARRVSVEAGNRAVEIVVDYDEVARLAVAARTPCAEVLERLKNVGVTSVAVTSPTLGELVSSGAIDALGANRYSVTGWDVTAIRSLAQFVGDWPVAVEQSAVSGSAPEGIIRTQVPIGSIADLPAGFSPQAIADARKAGLGVVARIPGFPGANRGSIDGIVNYLRTCGARTVIFKGDQVLGFKSAEADTAGAMRGNDMWFGRVEFARQKGESKLAKAAPERVIVVHSVPQNEMPGLDDVTVIERFARAVRERGARMCYVRMFYISSDDIVRDNCRYVYAVTRGILQAGGVTGECRPFREVDSPRVLKWAAAAGIGVGVALAVLAVVDLSAGAAVVLSLVLVAGCFGLGMAGDTGSKMVALCGAIFFPVLGVLNACRLTSPWPSPTRGGKCSSDSPSSCRGGKCSSNSPSPTKGGKCSPNSPSPSRGRQGRGPVGEAIERLLLAVFFTATGGLLVAAVLSSRAFMLRIDQFAGVKVAQIAPILILGLLFIGGIAWRSDTWQAQTRRFGNGFRHAMSNPVVVWQMLGLVALLVILGLMVARSGNDAGVGVSPLELKFRSLLDRVVLVRPRTKEFMIGYPLLLCGLAFAVRGYRNWGAPLIVVGSIGLVSALNTFCHIHTPVMLSVLRVVNGAVVGTAIGLILYALVRRLPDMGSEPAKSSE